MDKGMMLSRWSKTICVVGGLMVLLGNATSAHAQVVYAPPLGYATPVGYTQAYVYRPVTVYSTPTVTYAPVVVTPRPYVAYSSPVFVPAPTVVRDRERFGVFGSRVYNYNAYGPAFEHVHYRARDGWLFHGERVRFSRN